MNKQKNKVVFILGAGFSAPALGFTQKHILKKLSEKNESGTNEIFQFIQGVWGERTKVPLEDVYTLLDRSIAGRESVGKWNPLELNQIHSDLGDEIAKLHSEKAADCKTNYLNVFADKLCEFRWDLFNEKQSDKKFHDDRVSIISTNWDIQLEQELGTKMKTFQLSPSIWDTVERGMFMDFCMFEFQLKNDKKYMKNYIPPSIRIKAYGFANLKLLKLHGGINWFQCSRCDGIVVNLSSEPYYTPTYKDEICPACQENFGESVDQHSPLKRYFVSPTFLKDFSGTHFRSIWWNAGYEIVEASQIIFIGYSLPLSDYDFRHLVARNLDKNASVTAILMKREGDCESVRDFDQAKTNYKAFFGRGVTIKEYGVEEFIKNGDFDKVLQSVK